MIITTYLANHEAYEKKNNLLKQAGIRHLTDEEKTELDELIHAIQIFEDEILLNFE